MAEVLNDSKEIKRRDANGMLDIVGRFDEQIEEALGIGAAAKLPGLTQTIHNILLCGLGGSAIGGDFLRSYLGDDLKVPFTVSRNYAIPGFAGESTLALICSYSGNTEETLSSFQEAVDAGCQIICLSSNGLLEELAGKHSFRCIKIPGGLPPRTALGYSAIPLLVALGRLRLIPDRTKEVRRSLDLVRRTAGLYGSETPVEKNEAKRLALQLHGKIPLIYGSQDRLEMVAVRWRGQFSENGKQLAYSSTLPEMNHNEIVGWKHPDSALSNLVPIFLRDREDHPRVGIRADITRQLVSEKSGTSLEYWTQGETWLERLWSLILLGDYASIYLALLNEENPTPVEVIDLLKNRLKNKQ